MKSILLLLGSIMLSTTAFAQKIANDKVPSEVMAGFKAKFPSVTKSVWEMESASEYEAEFDIKAKSIRLNLINPVNGWKPKRRLK